MENTQPKDLVQHNQIPLNPNMVRKQINLIQHIMKEMMTEDVHYGVIPGTRKPMLFKAGAEKLCLTFRLATSYEIISKTQEKDFISYTLKCTLKHMKTGEVIAEGIGACNSRETKYHYQYSPAIEKPSRAEAKKLKAAGLGKWKKVGEQWIWLTFRGHNT